MIAYRQNKNLTITKKQEAKLRRWHGKINNREIAQKLGLTYNVLYNNIKVLGLHKSKGKECKAGYFDIDKWAKEFIY